MKYLEINEDTASLPISVTIDTDVSGIVILAKLCLFADEIDMGDDYYMDHIYNQLIVCLEQYGNIILSENIIEGDY